eukprot:1837807-Pleurochrysis_carterae.AAC.1
MRNFAHICTSPYRIDERWVQLRKFSSSLFPNQPCYAQLTEGEIVHEWRDQSGHGHHARRRLASGVEDPSAGDDGGNPRLSREPVSGLPVLKWDYGSGTDGFLEAAGLKIDVGDSFTAIVVARSTSEGWPERGSR